MLLTYRLEKWRNGSLWDAVKARILRSLMLLAQTFDLDNILRPDHGKEEHDLVVLVNHEYAQLREQKLKSKLSKTPAKPSLLAESSMWSNTSKTEEEHEQRCERCSKRTRLVWFYWCPLCHEATATMHMHCSDGMRAKCVIVHRFIV